MAHCLNTKLMVFCNSIQLSFGLNYLALSIILINMFTFCSCIVSNKLQKHPFEPILISEELIYLSIFYHPESPPALLQMTLRIPLWVIRETRVFNGERVIASFRIVSLLLPLFRPSAQTIQIHHFLISLVNSVQNWFFFLWWFWTDDFSRE